MLNFKGDAILDRRRADTACMLTRFLKLTRRLLLTRGAPQPGLWNEAGICGPEGTCCVTHNGNSIGK
jgi:hypothetical protein